MAEPTGLALVDRIDADALQARARSLFANPAVQRARPAILIVGGIVISLVVLWLAMRSPDWRPLYGEMSDGDKSAVMTALEAGNYDDAHQP